MPASRICPSGSRWNKANLPTPDALLDRIERHRVDVVLVEASRVSLPLEEFVRRLQNTAAQPAVFVLHPDASPELILEALRAGAERIPLSPFGRYAPGRFREALRVAHQRRGGNASAPWVKSSVSSPPAAAAAPPHSRFMWPRTSRGRANSRCCWPISISRPDCCDS